MAKRTDNPNQTLTIILTVRGA